MDEIVNGAVTAVYLADESVQRQWFELICQTYEHLAAAGRVEWAPYTESLNQGADAAGVGRVMAQQFIDYLAYNDSAPVETVRKMHELGIGLPELYQHLAAHQATTQLSGADGYDEATWTAFLAENGVHWNGDVASWEQFKAWFLHHAGEQHLTVPANGFIGYVESQPDKAAAFAQYGLHVSGAAAASEAAPAAAAPAVDASTFPSIKEGDSGEWVDYLDAVLKSKGF